MLEVGLGDTPMRLAEKRTGNPYRYGELLAANPHKSLVYADGMPTFKSLGVGERLALPQGWLGAGPPSQMQAGQGQQYLEAVNHGDPGYVGSHLVSPNGQFRLEMQPDGNLVIYGPGNAVLRAWGARGGRVTFNMQPDGNLVLYQDGHPVWDAGTRGSGGRVVMQDDGNLVVYFGNSPAWSSETNGGKQYDPGTTVFQKIGSAVSSIPIVGDGVNIIGEAAAAPYHLASAIASGGNIGDAALGYFKDQIKIVKDVAPYAQTIVSFVPGLGTGVSMAIGAGVALAEGQSITDAAKSAIRSAIPGGPLVVAGFDAALKVASGENVGQVALEAARSQLPPEAQKAFDIGLAVVTGEKLQTALANGLASFAPGQLQTILDAGQHALATVPGLSDALKSVPIGPATDGFKLAAGLLSHSGISEKSLLAARSQLPPDVVQGFDAALKTQEPHLAWLKNVTSAPTAPQSAVQRAFVATMAQVKGVTGSAPKTLEPPKRVAVAQPAPQRTPPKTLEPPKRAVATAPAPARTPPKTLEPPKRVATATPTPVTPASALAAGRYAPYPKSVTGVSAPPHGHAHHGGHAPHGGGHVPHGGRATPGWGWSDVPWGTDVVMETQTCRTWGAPIEMSPTMQVSAKVALGASSGQPVTMRSDGVLYLFTLENGAISARPCAVTGLGACFDMTEVTWGPAITGMSGDMRRAGLSAVNGSRGRPRAVKGPDGTDYLFAMENGTLTARAAVQ